MSNLCRINSEQLVKILADFWPKPICLLCHQSLPQFARICEACLSQLPWTQDKIVLSGLGNICVAMDYAPPIDQLVLGGKFSGHIANLSLLAELFISYWQKNQIPLPEVLIPVPLHAQRLRERGYNQALELAKIIGRKLQVPVDFTSVKRIKATQAQASLPAKMRAGNMRGAFSLRKALNYSHVAIIDDVFTTGNTVRELSELLHASNVKQVDVYCVARALL
jgi:ComF family protein